MAKLPKIYQSKELSQELKISLTELLPAQIAWDLAQFPPPSLTTPIPSLQTLLEPGLDLDALYDLFQNLEAIPAAQKPQARETLVSHLQQYLEDGVFEIHELQDLEKRLDFQDFHTLAELKTAFAHSLSLLAQDQGHFYDLMGLVFEAPPEKYIPLYQALRDGRCPFPAQIALVDEDVLAAHPAAYTPKDGGSLYLNEKLSFKVCLQVLSAEMAQHLASFLAIPAPPGCGEKLLQTLTGQVLPSLELPMSERISGDRLQGFLEEVRETPAFFISELTDGKIWTGMTSRDLEDLLLYAAVKQGKVNNYLTEKKALLQILISHLPQIDDKYAMAQALVEVLSARDIAKNLKDFLLEALLLAFENPEARSLAPYLTAKLRDALLNRLTKTQGEARRQILEALKRYHQSPHLSAGDQLIFAKIWGDFLLEKINTLETWPEIQNIEKFLDFLLALPKAAFSQAWLGYRQTRIQQHLSNLLQSLADWKQAQLLIQRLDSSAQS